MLRKKRMSKNYSKFKLKCLKINLQVKNKAGLECVKTNISSSCSRHEDVWKIPLERRKLVPVLLWNTVKS